MKLLHTIYFILVSVSHLYAIEINNRELEIIKSVTEIGEPKTEENLLFLVSIITDESLENKRLKDIASFKLKDIYIPNGAISNWKGSNFIVTKDIIEYVKSRTESEIFQWLFVADEIVYESNTYKYRLRIYRSDIERLEELGISNISIADLISINISAIEKNENNVKLEKISLVRPFGFDEWIAVGMYTDKNGDQRLLAVLNKSEILFDQLKDDEGF